MSAPRRPSLRRRLGATVIMVSLVWSVALAGIVTYTVRQAADALLDNALQESAEILYGLIRSHVDTVPVPNGRALPAPPHDEHLVWQVVSAQGTVRWRSHRAPDVPLLAAPQPGFAQAVAGTGGWRVYGMALGRGEQLYVAQVAHVRQELSWRAAATSAVVALLAGALSALWLSRRMSRALQPLGELSAAVNQYDPLKPARAPLPATVSELEPMRRAIHELGERLARRVSSERSFAAHAAHALRTPLAGMMAQLAVAQVKSPPEALPHLQRMETALVRLRSVVSALLALFRAEQAEPRLQPLRLSELVRHLPVESLQVSVTQDGEFWGDGDLLAAALLNLLDNAQKHGATVVQLRLDADQGPDGPWHLRITDNGQGLTPQASAALQARLDAQAYAELGGLGLMLSDLIGRVHGGRLGLHSLPAGLRVDLSGAGRVGSASQS